MCRVIIILNLLRKIKYKKYVLKVMVINNKINKLAKNSY